MNAPRKPPVKLDPDTLEVAPLYDFETTLCIGVTFRDAQSRRPSGAHIVMLESRPDLDSETLWGHPGWHWHQDADAHALVFRLAPTDRELYAALWDLQENPVAREHWLARVATWDPDDRDEWICRLLSIGAELTPEGTRILHQEIAEEPQRLKRRFAALQRDLDDEARERAP